MSSSASKCVGTSMCRYTSMCATPENRGHGHAGRWNHVAAPTTSAESVRLADKQRPVADHAAMSVSIVEGAWLMDEQ